MQSHVGTVSISIDAGYLAYTYLYEEIGELVAFDSQLLHAAKVILEL